MQSTVHEEWPPNKTCTSPLVSQETTNLADGSEQAKWYCGTTYVCTCTMNNTIWKYGLTIVTVIGMPPVMRNSFQNKSVVLPCQCLMALKQTEVVSHLDSSEHQWYMGIAGCFCTWEKEKWKCQFQCQSGALNTLKIIHMHYWSVGYKPKRCANDKAYDICQWCCKQSTQRNRSLW